MHYTRYQYEELRSKALSSDATQEDINRLGEWFSQYGEVYWNGMYYDVGNGVTLWPVYKEYFAIECRFPGSDGWQHICVTDDPDGEIEHQATLEDNGDVEYRAEIDHIVITRYNISLLQGVVD